MSQEDKPVAEQDPVAIVNERGLGFIANGKDYPKAGTLLYSHAEPCARCADLEAFNQRRIEEVEELQAKITEQADHIAMYRAEMSAALDAGFTTAQDLYTSYIGQADRIKALESKLASANAVINVSKSALIRIEIEGHRHEDTYYQCQEALAAIAAYEKGE